MERENNVVVDNDSDLSFEALTFGDTSNTDNQQDKNGRQFPKKKDKFRKKPNSKKDGAPHTPEGEREKSSSVYISTQDEKIDVPPLLRKMEQFGAVRGYYFKEKQNFGIVQFVDPMVVDTVIENFTDADLGFHATVERTARTKDHHASPHSFGSIPPTPSAAPSTPPPEKPDTILVLKNLPFTLKQDQLHEILLSLSTTIPQSISLHYDNVGVFRGMAFIKYRQLEDAIQVYELLNGMDVGGRKVRVEYKRKTANSAPTTPRGQPAPIDIPVEWQEDEELRKLWEQLSHFKDDPTQSEWYYPSTLTNNQRRNIYHMTEKLKLVQGSSTDSEVKALYLKKHQTTPHTMEHSGSVDSKIGRGVDIKGARRPRHDDANARAGVGGSPDATRTGGRNSVGSRTEPPNKHTVVSSAPADINLDWRNQPNQAQPQNQSPNQSQNQSQPSSQQQHPLVAPVRQPKGPDGSKGFGDQYRTARKLTMTTTCSFLVAPSTEVVV